MKMIENPNIPKPTGVYPILDRFYYERAIAAIEKGYTSGSIISRYVGIACLLYTSPSPRDRQKSRMPSSA